MTPAELFSPTYGRSIANCVLQHRAAQHSDGAAAPLDIVEIGGGNGTLAADVLVSFASLHSTVIAHAH